MHKAVTPVSILTHTHSAIPAELEAALSTFVAMLLKWNKTLNLIGRSTVGEVWERHIEDSLQLLEHIPAGATNLVDFGSGAGFPGLVLALAGAPNVHLIESNYRKAAFLKEAARVLGAPAVVLNARIENAAPFKADVITARAFAPLTEILTHAQPFLHPKTTLILLKGENAESEILAAKTHYAFECKTLPSAVAPKGGKRGSILIITSVRSI